MDEYQGFDKPDLQALPHLQSRLTFLYLEHSKLNRDANAITILDKNGITHVPAAGICAILLGPGTSITHQAVELIANAGVTLIWTGE